MSSADEALPRDALDRYFRVHLPAVGPIHEIRKFAGGQSNPTFLMTGTTGRFVLRAKPSGKLLKSAHAVDREFRVLRALAGSGVPVPAVYHFCADETVIGRWFYVMEYVEGRLYWDPELPEVSSDGRTRIYDAMNRVQVALHELDPAAIGLSDFGRPDHYFERQIRRWTEQYRASQTELHPDVERLIEWLPENIPPDDGQVSLVHGDFRLDNLIFDEAGRAVALLDWELCTLGHPFADLAYQCAQWRLPARGALRGLKGIDREGLGIPMEEAYVAAYLRRRGLPSRVPSWEFYLVVSLFRLAAICQGVYKRGLDGNASSPAALEYGTKAGTIAHEAAMIADAAGG